MGCYSYRSYDHLSGEENDCLQPQEMSQKTLKVEFQHQEISRSIEDSWINHS
jgi:hypothetical protein